MNVQNAGVKILVEGSVLLFLMWCYLFIYFFPWQITFSARKAETLPVTEMAPTELLSRRCSP